MPRRIVTPRKKAAGSQIESQRRECTFKGKRSVLADGCSKIRQAFFEKTTIFLHFLPIPYRAKIKTKKDTFKKNSSSACETVEKSASVEKLLKGPAGSFQ